jgi:hypothetical protein
MIFLLLSDCPLGRHVHIGKSVAKCPAAQGSSLSPFVMWPIRWPACLDTDRGKGEMTLNKSTSIEKFNAGNISELITPDKSRNRTCPVCSAGTLLEKLAPLLACWRRQLTLAAFIARLEGAGVTSLILGMDDAEPPPADTAVESCDGIAGLICGRNGLTRPLEVPGFCLIHLLQQIPSSSAQYTPGCRYGGQREVALNPE